MNWKLADFSHIGITSHCAILKRKFIAFRCNHFLRQVNYKFSGKGGVNFKNRRSLSVFLECSVRSRGLWTISRVSFLTWSLNFGQDLFLVLLRFLNSSKYVSALEQAQDGNREAWKMAPRQISCFPSRAPCFMLKSTPFGQRFLFYRNFSLKTSIHVVLENSRTVGGSSIQCKFPNISVKISLNFWKIPLFR